jgi:glycosyltransferase involved in cell wall biosynthesis
VLIICTHELLLIGTLYKLFSGSKLIYDIQENYFFNLLYQNNYPWLLRHLLALYVRVKEVLLANFINYFLLAEQCYVDELSFIKQRYSIIENKFIQPEIDRKEQNNSQVEFLISGTISKEYGVFDALHFFSQLLASKYKLVIVGHCPNQHTFRALKKAVKGLDNIDFTVSTTPVPHQDILSQIGEHSIGLLPYQVNKSTQNKIPTKLYEYIGLGIPILISPNPLWDKIIERYHTGLSIDFKSPISIDEIRQRLTSIKQNQVIDLKDIMWNNEETKLLAIFKDLLS